MRLTCGVRFLKPDPLQLEPDQIRCCRIAWRILTFIETKLFSRLVPEFLSDEEYASVQSELIDNPEAGAVIRGSGGVTKLRVAAQGRGKSDGYRVIYYLGRPKGVVWMFDLSHQTLTLG